MFWSAMVKLHDLPVADTALFSPTPSMLVRLSRHCGSLEVCEDLPSLLNSLAQELRELLGARTVAVVLLLPGDLRPRLALRGQRHWGDNHLALFERQRSGRALGDGWQLAEPLTSPFPRGQKFACTFGQAERLSGMVFVDLGEDRGEREPEAVLALCLLTRHATALARTLVLREQVNQDELTGCLSRRAVLGTLDRELHRCFRYRRGLSVGMADLDGLKKINDRFGHPAGDRALQEVARRLVTTLRTSDAVGRHGGDEFVLILPETPREGALHLGHKVCRKIREEPAAVGEGEWVDLRLSLGLVTIHGDLDRPPSPEAVLEVADRALYRVKAAEPGGVGWSPWAGGPAESGDPLAVPHGGA